jgi:hypothetical protein
VKLYKMKHLIEVTGWSRKKLSQWLQQGIVEAEVPPKRAGIAAEFSFNNIIQFIVTDKLVNAGISIRTAAELAEEAVLFAEDVHPYEDEYWMVVNLEDIKEHDYFHIKPDEADLYDITLMIRLHPIFRDTAKKVKALDKD